MAILSDAEMIRNQLDKGKEWAKLFLAVDGNLSQQSFVSFYCLYYFATRKRHLEVKYTYSTVCLYLAIVMEWVLEWSG